METTNQVLSYPKKFMEALSAPFVGREEEAKVITLALLSGEHVILVGEPGTAKSALARRAAELLDAKFFMYLLTKYTEPSELFGPLDINALKQGVYKRVTKGKLLESEIIFLDEIFKASSAILNTLLSVINERQYYNGDEIIQVPLRTLISASNEIPDEPELEALYDRLLIRQFTKPIDQGYIKDLLKSAWSYEFNKKEKVEKIMSIQDLDRLYELIQKVDLSPILDKLIELILLFEAKDIHISDRRKGKIPKLVATSAILNGRLTAVEEDLLVLKYIIPQTQEDLVQVSGILTEKIKSSERYLKELEEIRSNLIKTKTLVQEEKDSEKLIEISKSLKPMKDRIIEINKETDNEKVRNISTELLKEINDLGEKIRDKVGLA